MGEKGIRKESGLREGNRACGVAGEKEGSTREGEKRDITQVDAGKGGCNEGKNKWSCEGRTDGVGRGQDPTSPLTTPLPPLSQPPFWIVMPPFVCQGANRI